jgi:hypothetical protein
MYRKISTILLIVTIILLIDCGATIHYNTTFLYGAEKSYSKDGKLKMEEEKIPLDKGYNFEYVIYSTIFSKTKEIEIDSTNFCPPYRKMYITIERPIWSSVLSYLTLTIPFRMTKLIITCI